MLLPPFPPLPGILGAIVGGLVAAWGAVKAVEKTSQDLELTEIRRQKVECIVALNGLRWVIADGGSPPDEYKAKFNYEMNKITPLWADDPEVMKNLRDFYVNTTTSGSSCFYGTLATPPNSQLAS